MPDITYGATVNDIDRPLLGQAVVKELSEARSTLEVRS